MANEFSGNRSRNPVAAVGLNPDTPHLLLKIFAGSGGPEPNTRLEGAKNSIIPRIPAS